MTLPHHSIAILLSVALLMGACGAHGSSAAKPLPPTAAKGFVAAHGALHVSGGQVVDAAGAPLQLRGMSLFWSQWSSFHTAAAVDQLVDDWHAGLVRVPLGIEEDGYLAHPAENEAKVQVAVDRAIARGIYVIIDWHDHRASEHEAAAVSFFTRMAQKYGASPHVIFELWNEPLAVSWDVVKQYAESVIAAIRDTGAANLVLVGTPNWSQDIHAAAASPLAGANDVAYVLHFYAATHGQWLRDRAQSVIASGLPLFVTEWGTCEATGNGGVDEAETQAWIALLAQHHISWANWALNDRAESCSALQPHASPTGPWTGAALTRSGALVKALIP